MTSNDKAKKTGSYWDNEKTNHPTIVEKKT